MYQNADREHKHITEDKVRGGVSQNLALDFKEGAWPIKKSYKGVGGKALLISASYVIYSSSHTQKCTTGTVVQYWCIASQ